MVSVHSGNQTAALSDLLGQAMTHLAKRRPIFHSEADYQLALAWQIQTDHPDAEIRLEKRLLRNPPVALDLLVHLSEHRYAIELKYLKRALTVEIRGEHFKLAAGAPDIERYDALKDVARLERLVDGGEVDAGCAVLLTNAEGFWSPSHSGRITAFDAFRLHDGREIAGELAWGQTAGPGTRAGREAPVTLRGRYRLRWMPYSKLGPGPGQELRYLPLYVSASSPDRP